MQHGPGRRKRPDVEQPGPCGNTRAEASFRTWNTVVTDLLDLSRQLTRVMPIDRLIPRFDVVRKGLLAISTSRPDDLSDIRLLANVERQMGEYLMQAKRSEEARSIMRDSLDRLESVRKA